MCLMSTLGCSEYETSRWHRLSTKGLLVANGGIAAERSTLSCSRQYSARLSIEFITGRADYPRQYEATRKIAARLRSTSASVVAHDDTLIRIAA